MKRVFIRKTIIGAVLLVAFAAWTFAVCTVDVKPVHPVGAEVGFAGLNVEFHNLTGVHMALYNITDILSVVPFMFAAGFGMLGLVQWCKRKNLLKVDRSLLAMGIFLIVVLGVFVLFENMSVNYRPVLIEGRLEKSYPSSTTMLVMCVMPVSAMQLNMRIKPAALRKISVYAVLVFTAFMVICRTVSGVHWLTDIIGGMLVSAGLVVLYDAFR